ncbi:hypothetical protein PybrP1_004791 [[Pythium] brassicae (nom. inval.)]|nr:hypothetical protein PybrP1_004791 [[Pythium] brassicae (nom. inval.)]
MPRSPALLWRLAIGAVLILLLCALPHARHSRHAAGTDRTDVVQWLDEGAEASATLRNWEAQESFCFYDNATLRIRLDALDSPLQPYVVRAFGQSKEAHEIFDFLMATLSSLQEYAWPFRSFFWAWSDLRVVVTSAQHEELQFAYTRSAGMLCRGMLWADKSVPLLGEWIPDDAVEYIHVAIRFLSKYLCENCVHGCSRECTPLDSDSCMVVLSPYHAPCLTVTAPTKPFLGSTTPSIPITVVFQTVLSSLFVQNFFLGLFLFYSSERLSRSRTFHYFLGASIGICFSAMLALYFFSRQTRAAAKMVPGAQFLQSVGSLVSFAVPFTSFVLMPSIYKLVSWGLGYLAYVWSCEELLGIPHLGKIYFFFFGFLGFVLVWWNQWGASPKSDQKQDEAEIEELGYLDEDLPLTTAQMALSRILKLLGVALLFYSTSSTEISLLLVLLVSLTRLFQFLATTFYFWYHYERAGRHSVLISKKEFEKQAVSETEKALKELQAFLQKNPDELDKVSEENEIRLRRFMKGRNHMDVATRESALSARQRAHKSIWSSCSVQ